MIVDTTADSEYVVGKICDGPDFRISEHRWVVENPSPIHNLRIWCKTSIVQNISRSYLIRAFVDTFRYIRIIDLMKFSLDSDVVFEIIRCIEAISLEVLRPVVSVRQVEHIADL